MSFPRYEKYKDSGVGWMGEVPVHWKVTQVRHLVECLDGRRIPLNASERSAKQGDVPYWGANCIVDYVDEALFDEDLVLLGEDGAPFFDRTKSVAFFTRGPVWPNNHVHVLRPRTGLSGPFLAYALNATNYSEFIDGSTRDKLTQGAMAAIPVSIPDIEEQGAIAAFLDHETAKIDALVEEQKRLIELLKEKRQAVISHAVKRGLSRNTPMKDSGVEWLGEVPAHWEVKSIRYIIDAIGDVDHFMPQSIEKGVPYLMTGDLKDLVSEVSLEDCKQVSHSDFLELSKRIRTAKGDVVMARYATIGTLMYVDIAVDLLVSYSCVTLKTNHSKMSGRYLFQYMKSDTFSQAVEHQVNTNTQGNVGINDLQTLKVAVPPVDEQDSIAAFLATENLKMDALKAESERAIALLTERRTALISAAVTGKIDVRGLQSETY